MTEDQFQAELFAWAWNAFPHARRHFWAVPNGAWFANKIIAKKMQATGVVAGVWDIHLYWLRTFYIFELKVGANTTSPAQNL